MDRPVLQGDQTGALSLHQFVANLVFPGPSGHFPYLTTGGVVCGGQDLDTNWA